MRTTVAVWMGSTLGCAECHDHKFDPFTSRDFYSMKAFFADIKETGLVPDRGEKAWGSVMALPTPEQQKRREELQAQLAEARARLAGAVEKLAAQQDAWKRKLLAQYETGDLAWHSAARKALKSCSPISSAAASRIACASSGRNVQPTAPLSSAGRTGDSSSR